MKHRWLVIIGTALRTLLVAQTARSPEAQTERRPHARIAIMRALDGHSVELEAGYIRHLEWHRQAKDTFNWYSYSVWASTERQRWIIYATFGHTAAELSNPVSPAEDERDNLINVLPHAQFLGNGVYEFLPALSRGNAYRLRRFAPSTRRWSSTTVQERRSRRRLPPNNQNCAGKRSGTGWSSAEICRATSACVRVLVWRTFWISALLKRFLTK
jgi:hypothetical protein